MNEYKNITELSQELLWCIKQTVTARAMGFHEAKKAKDIVALVYRFHGITTNTRTVRRAINHCRNNDLLPGLCATPHIGYWIAESSEEIEDCIDSLRSRIINQLRTYRNLKKDKLRFELKEQKSKYFHNPDQAVQPGSTKL